MVVVVGVFAKRDDSGTGGLAETLLRADEMR